MNLKHVKKGVAVMMAAGTVMVPAQHILASGTGLIEPVKQEKSAAIDNQCLVNAISKVQKDYKTKTIKVVSGDEIRFNERLGTRAFVLTMDGYAEVLTRPDEESTVNGKVFEDSLVEITEKGEVWSRIASGNVSGYVKTRCLVTGKEMLSRVRACAMESYPWEDPFLLEVWEIERLFSVGETRVEETLRLQAEEAMRVAAEEARIAAIEEARKNRGIELVEFAKQFTGNPYVYGGVSLTNGADCSGFVRSVYAHFGVSLPHSSYRLRSVGYEVSFSEIRPGDIVCYEGHVGIYAGGGKIVNAIDEERGIGMSNAAYAPVITVRRIF